MMFFRIAVSLFTLVIVPQAWADTLMSTLGPFTWTDNCSEQIRVTVKIYTVPGTPIKYRWDYQVDNVSVTSNYPGDGLNGLSYFDMIFASALSDLGSVTADTGWTATTSTDGDGNTVVFAYANSGSLGTGGTIHFGFTTNKRLVKRFSACSFDGSGQVIQNTCAYAERAEDLGFGFVRRPVGVATGSTWDVRHAEAKRLKPRDTTVCSEAITGTLSVPGDEFSMDGISVSQPATCDAVTSSCPTVTPATSTNLVSDFATGDSTDLVTVLKGTGTLTIDGVNIQPSGSSDQVKWHIDRDPSDTVDSGTPAVSGSPGGEVTLDPTTAGNFRLIAYVDVDSSGSFDEGEQVGVLRFAVVQTSLIDSTFVVEDTLDGSSVASVVTNPSGDINSAPMRYNAEYLLEGGGASRTIGTSAITVGGIGNLTSDTFAVSYPGGTAGTGTEDPGGATPMVDTSRVTVGNQPTGGVSAFRATWSPSDVPGDVPGSGGRAINFITGDAPVFTWRNVHPTTSNTWASTSGGVTFREFAVAFSSSFPQTYLRLNQATWTVAVVGNNSSGWEEAAAGDVTGDSALQSPTSAIQVLGKSYRNENHIVYTP